MGLLTYTFTMIFSYTAAAISKISFWIVLLTYLTFFGPEVTSLRSVLDLASNLKIELKLPSLYV